MQLSVNIIYHTTKILYTHMVLFKEMHVHVHTHTHAHTDTCREKDRGGQTDRRTESLLNSECSYWLLAMIRLKRISSSVGDTYLFIFDVKQTWGTCLLQNLRSLRSLYEVIWNGVCRIQTLWNPKQHIFILGLEYGTKRNYQWETAGNCTIKRKVIPPKWTAFSYNTQYKLC